MSRPAGLKLVIQRRRRRRRRSRRASKY